MSKLNHTPIYINFTNPLETNLLVKEVDPIIQPIPIEEREDLILAPRLYILIYPPGNLIPSSSLYPLKINIPLSGSLPGQVRLQLQPSSGYGINSCYRIEYWKWYPFVPGFTKGKENKKQRRITQEFIRQEHWLIPAIDGRTWGVHWLHAHHSLHEVPIRKRALDSIQVTLTRKFTNPAASQWLVAPIEGPIPVIGIPNPAYNYVQDYFPTPVPSEYAPIFVSPPTTPFEMGELYNTPDATKPYDKYLTEVYIDYKGVLPAPDDLPLTRNGSISVTYRLNYIEPLRLGEILFMDYEEEGNYTMVTRWGL